MKEKIYFIPSYLGSLKYYERIFPFLLEKYDARFLMVKGKGTRKIVLHYCKEKGYKCDEIEEVSPGRLRIPFFSAFFKRYKLIKNCRKFLEIHQPIKLISFKIDNPTFEIFREANRIGIETIFIPYSLFSGSGKDFNWIRTPNIKHRQSFGKRVYFFLFSLFSRSMDCFLFGLKYIFLSARPKKIGVSNEKAAKDIITHFGRKGIKVVGMVDFQFARELQNKINTDIEFKNKLGRKYNVNLNKTIILVIGQHYYLRVGLVDQKEQEDYFYQLCKSIRSVFSQNQSEILFKLHPASSNIYQRCENLGVKIYGDDASTDELICLSDLCISDHWTGANCIILASDTQALFLNIPPMKSSVASLDYYKIKTTINNWQDFSDKLAEFKDNKLEKQYDNSWIDFNSIESIINFIAD